MSDSDDNPLVRGFRRVRQSRRVALLRRPASWARGLAEAQLERALASLVTVENTRRLQSVLASVAQRGMELGFSADPEAARLYEFVTWLEQRHGRQPVLLRIAEHAATAEDNLLRGLEAIVSGYAEPPGSAERQRAAEQMHHLRDEVATDLLNLLCSLIALEHGDEPPLVSSQAYFESVDMPDQFRDLAAKAVGAPGSFESVETTHDDPAQAGLVRFTPSFDDPYLRFLALSQLFFIQSYLTRNLIELLPELVVAGEASTN